MNDIKKRFLSDQLYEILPKYHQLLGNEVVLETSKIVFWKYMYPLEHPCIAWLSNEKDNHT